MKKTAFILGILLLLTTSSFSQEEKNNTQDRIVKNEVSLEILNVINGVYQFSYERYLGKNFAVALALGYKGKKGLVGISGIDSDKLKTGDLFYTGFQIAPEIRYYISKTSTNNLNGFYVGAYLKYHNYKSDLTGTYISNNQTNYNLAFEAKFNITSVGLMIGYKLPITKRLNIDFLIAGPGSGSYKFSFKNKTDLPDEFYEDLNEALEDYSLLDFINSDFRFSQVDSTSKFSAVSFRYGIALGFTF
jgi:hypothetical protein